MNKNALQTQSQQSNNKAYYSPLPLKEVGGEAVFYGRKRTKRFANTMPTTQQQGILLPSPLGEGLGVRLVEGAELAVNGWGEAGSRAEGEASCC